jgi:NADH-quinone oxidoreductase subunit L
VSDPLGFALAILVLPLVAALAAALLSRSSRAELAHIPLVTASAASAVLGAWLLLLVDDRPGHAVVGNLATWFAAGKLSVYFSVTIDPLAAVMLAMVTFVALWIAVFSSGYMHGDRGYGRFFAVMSLFVFSMCGLVLANNFLVLVAFWEGVGLCSYLLVGYYYDKPAAAAAARKAFLVTRIGDTGLILGVLLLWKLGGWNTDLTAVFDHIRTHTPDTAELTTACLLLFCGAVGKSAQFPLYVWLPDAMEGPTPVSALIHAATMVTAGVYLLARCAPLLVICPEARFLVGVTGGITAVLAAFLALAQTDLKRILAYSTVSQLGLMFLALGTAGAISPALAVTAAMFHLFTHAFFKALLFLAAGSVMHALGGVIDVRKFGGLRKRLPVTHLTFLCGAAALAGVPLLSGFWSKDLVLEAVQQAGHRGPHATGYLFLFGVALLTTFLTAFYTFRAYFLSFWGAERVPEVPEVPGEAGPHAHESPPVMTVPLLVLAVGALFVGIVAEPFTHWFSHFLGQTPTLAPQVLADGLAPRATAHGTTAADPGLNAGPNHGFNWTTAGLSTACALAGIGLAYAVYRRGEPQRYPAPVETLFSLSRNKLYVEDIYEAVVVKPAGILAFLAAAFDGFLDGLTRLIAAVPRFIGQWARPVQNGLVQFYALSMALGLVVFLTFVMFRVAR